MCNCLAETSKNATISVIVPVYNGENTLQVCLDSIEKACPRPDQVVVVDDGSTDRSASIAREMGFKVISTAGRTGASNARNLGARHTTGGILLFVDADCSVKLDVVDRVRSLVENHSDTDAFVGSYDDAPTAKNMLSQYKNLHHHFTHQMSAPEGHTFWGACGVIRRAAFEQLGGFDPRYSKASIEDIELGYRLKAAGRKIRMCPDLQVTHHKRWRPLSLLKTDLFLRAVPWSRLILKKGEMANALNISRAARLRVLLTGLISLCLLAAIFYPSILWVVAILALFLLAADWKVLYWFYRKRGLSFTLAILPWHWFSHFYSGVGFALAMLVHSWEAFCVPRIDRRGSSIPESDLKGSTTS